jgi:hypothetical protein
MILKVPMMIQKETNELLELLREIKTLLEKQSELLTNLTNNSTQTKITVVGNKATQSNTGLNSKEDFSL